VSPRKGIMRTNIISALFLSSLLLFTGCKPDADGDGFRSDVDCDDNDESINPEAAEVCDGIDQDCDEAIDEGLTELSWWVDGDGDGAGAGAVTTGCEGGPPTADSVAAEGDEDCDDADPNNTPGAAEICDGADNDCDGTADDGLDGDLDGVTSCGPDGIAGTADDDCDDSNGAVYPAATEACDGVDNDCNEEIDEGHDLDGDGVTTCGPDGADQTADDDCDDADDTVYPGASELCDEQDNDCDGLVDADDDDYAGEDNDGDGDSSIFCGGTDCNDNNAVLNGLDEDLDSQTSCDGDCLDVDPTVLIGGQEFCDNLDNNCNGLVDDGVGNDGDGDGFDTSGCAFFGSDCDDTDPHLFPQQEYTSGYQRQCAPAVRPGFANSWSYARLNLPSYFEDPQTGTHYLYFRGHNNPDFHQFGYSSSADGLTWNGVQGPIFSESATVGRWDGRRISHPSVVYVPGKPRPYLMAYHAQDDDTSDRLVGIATAVQATGDSDGTFKRMDLGGATVSEAVIPTSGNTTAVDNEQVLHPGLWYDPVGERVHMWYTGRFGAPNQFAIAHASCDVTVSDCGSPADWVKTDSGGNGDPDVWIEGDAGAWDDGDVRQAYVMANTDPNSYLGYDLEITYVGDELSIGAVVGDIDDASSWVKQDASPILEPSAEPNRCDSESVTGRGVRYDATTDEYHMYYGTSVVLPEQTDGQAISLLWGPGNYSSGASYIAHAINAAPAVVIDSADCSAISGEIEDSAPDTVVLEVFDGATPVGVPFTGDATGNTDVEVQSTTWTLSGLALGPGAHTLTVLATDAAGAERSDAISVTCP
jgi:hypothetical protein